MNDSKEHLDESNLAFLNGFLAKSVQPEFGFVGLEQLLANQFAQFCLKSDKKNKSNLMKS